MFKGYNLRNVKSWIFFCVVVLGIICIIIIVTSENWVADG